MGKRITLFGSSHSEPGSADYDETRRLGCLLAEEGYAVYTGGYLGAMAAASQGAREVGGHVVGVTLQSDGRTPNSWLTEEIVAATLHERLYRLMETDAWIAVNGGVGTLNEVMLGWALLQKTRPPLRRPLILVGPRWRRLVAAVTEILEIAPADQALLTLVDTPEKALEVLRKRL